MEKEQGLYSIDRYQGAGKWCFAIGANRAWDNYNERPKLFSESLLRYEKATRRDWFDEETRGLIKKSDVRQRLRKIRCYFSHYCHDNTCLGFDPDDDLRKIMEKAYERAIFEQRKHLSTETDIETPALFEPHGRITAAGVVFFCSFFVERRILNRLMGRIPGFKKTEGEYGATRQMFSKYCLRDSYSIRASDSNAVLFRDILGYLSRAPSQYYRHNKDQCDKDGHPERKKDKFINLALRYLESFVPARLRNHTLSVGRKEVVRMETNAVAEGEGEYRPYPPKAKVKVVFTEDDPERPYYITHNTVILQTAKKEEDIHHCKVGVNELKYLVLLCLQGKAEKAVAGIEGYVRRIQGRFADHTNKVARDDDERLVRGLPEFVRVASGIETPDEVRELKSRLDHIRKKWQTKKAESAEAQLHRKARDVLRHINWESQRPLGIEQYNRLLELLVNRDLESFAAEMKELKRRGLISEELLKSVEGIRNLNTLHVKVCNLVLTRLEHLVENDPEELKRHIGIVPREEKEGPSYEEKVRAFVQQPMMYRGFLRNSFFKGSGKSFAKLVEEELHKKGCPDVPLGTDYYLVRDLERDERKNRFHNDNAALYETLALDRLCVLMARDCLVRLNRNLEKHATRISWEATDAGDTICLELPRRDRDHESFRLSFGVRDYPKLYVMDDPVFLCGLMKHFFPDNQAIQYHELYSEGINKYTAMQAEGIAATLKLEEKTIKEKNMQIPATGYIRFCEIVSQSDFAPGEKRVLKNVRNGLLHYHLEFEPTEWAEFREIMKREGFDTAKKRKSTRKK
ncbi:MAG: hypothetical protein JW741_20550 [Sedimentisphaerales bacterium]|nr:hypothetical protein [Sedimentisphaerales bacterium]